jgi:hypothetical protein
MTKCKERMVGAIDAVTIENANIRVGESILVVIKNKSYGIYLGFSSKLMRLSKTTIIVTTILFIVLFLVGMRSYSSFFNLTLPKIDGVVYQANSVAGSFAMPLIYSLTLAAIPVATILLWKKANIHSATKRVLVPLVLFICIAIATLLRQYMLRTEIKKVADVTQSINDHTNENIKTAISLDKLDIEKYMLVGLIAGIVVVYFTMRPKTPTAFAQESPKAYFQSK